MRYYRFAPQPRPQGAEGGAAPEDRQGCVDEKTQIQALNRTQPVFPMLPGTPARASHDYVRHGTSSLYAALDLTTGKVIGSLHSRHRATEFLAFLRKIDAEVAADLDVHLVLDNASTHKTPAVKRWLIKHPRFVLHFTPTSSSWLNLVERWFSELTTKQLRRGTHTSVRQLNTDIRAWIDTWNDNPRPYVWTKTADQILESIGSYCRRINDSGSLAVGIDHHSRACTVLTGRRLSDQRPAQEPEPLSGTRRSVPIRAAAQQFLAVAKPHRPVRRSGPPGGR